MKKFLFVTIVFFSFSAALMAQETQNEPVKKIKKGWNLGLLPSIAFDADLGFQYGVLTNIFNYGDGSKYPEYLHSIYLEAAYTTKRYGIFRFNYDSKYLIPNHRLTIDASYIPDAMCDFYGYNGYQSIYNNLWHNSKNLTPEYQSRAFYKFRRDLLRLTGDIQGTIQNHWKWNVGLGFLNYSTGAVNLDVLNKGQDSLDLLPEIDELYDKYVKWKIFDENEIHGGFHPYIRLGVVYDSRDRQSNATKGIYSNLFLTYTSAFAEKKEFNNIKLNAVYQHYIPLVKEKLTFAYRVGAQLLIAGKSPFYMDNYLNTLFLQRAMYEAIGGANSTRGVLRSRVLADGFGYANFEFRWKAFQFDIGKQHFYIGFNPFIDMGMVLQPNKIDETAVIAAAQNDPTIVISQLDQYFDFETSSIYKPHFSVGCGLKVAMNENFVVSVDWAMPINEQDGAKKTNFYIKMGYLF
ncbi:MAG: hypothetical protein CVU04_01795 [Bacteroidetes bacterium HGW-Bacteroidetes-20]|nr:MAG: hypothetical protein CVU04_01795 [Bacteroidetes bacterium HGW-Bacteroidetes-20]